MKCRDNNWFVKNEEYRDHLNIMYDKVDGIHQYSKSYYFTDHSRKHSDRIAENLVHLFPFLFFEGKENVALNDVEKFILFAAILLHDIGIRLVNPETLNYIKEKYKIDGSYTETTVMDFIRNNHHTLSKCWIKENVETDNTILPTLYFGDKILAKYVANVSESHGISFEENLEYTEVTAYGSERIRMGLLCTLLSLGDALDCDQRRINYDLLKISELSLDSRLHWMKHYFVDGIVLTPNLIEIYYSFPNVDEDSKDLYKSYFVNKTKYWIEKCFTVRGKYLFPVGAICRVVDIIHYNDDKDKLTNKELLKIQDNYVGEILKAGKSHHIHFVQYLSGIVANKTKYLYIEPDCSFETCIMYDDKTECLECLSKHWNIIFSNEKSNWKLIGRTKIKNALYNYYLYEFDESKHSLGEKIKYKWLDLEELKGNIDSYMWELLANYLN